MTTKPDQRDLVQEATADTPVPVSLQHTPSEEPLKETIACQGEDGQSGGNEPDSPSTDFAALIDALKNEGIAYRKEEQSEDRGKKFREWIAIVLLAATLLAVICQVHEMIKVYGPIRDQAEAAKRAADAAALAADAAKAQSVAATNQSANSDKSLAAAQRAWVGPDAGTIDGPPTVGKPVVVSIAYHNTGKEPARNFIWIVNPLISSAADDDNGTLAAQFTTYMRDCFSTPDRDSAGVVFPTTGFGGTTLSVTYKGSAIDQAVVDGTKLLVIQGCFAYRTFDQTHHSAFCYFFRGDVSKSPNLNICPSGNNAD